MNNPYIERQGLDRFAKFDLSDSFHHIRRQQHETTWQGVYLYLLRQCDYESAEIVRLRNDRQYAKERAKGKG